MRQPNRLAQERSPYLLQHSENPVEWYPWGEEAFEKARVENKPVFLSIGYSACHWCHVMKRESFEDPGVARLMNETFVSIKVDREERPEIDNVYMAVCQLLTGSGGWPLTIIMTPDKKPFFAATYIPKEVKFGRIGMLELIPQIQRLWATRQAHIERSADEITAALQRVSMQTTRGEMGEELGESTLHLAYEELVERFDWQLGGFGTSPKFPTPHVLMLLLRYWKRTANEKALRMVEKTLEAMRMGGIYDQLGFGFHRYSTDSRWLVPHFEKMLYDQAMLAMVYTEAYQATAKDGYGRTAQEIFEYVLRDMTAPEGGFYSAEDAESEGIEGKFYLWTYDEIQRALAGGGEDRVDADLACEVFNVQKEGNFAEEATGERTGLNILYLGESIRVRESIENLASYQEMASRFKVSQEDLGRRLDVIRQQLFTQRQKRIHPNKDDKILTDWNGLMIAALAKGAQVLDEPKYSNAARVAAEFVVSHMRPSDEGGADGRLLHTCRDGQASVSALLDDYAFLILGMLELYESLFDVRYLRIALELNEELLKHFWDDDKGGFYLTADDSDSPLVRRKEIHDGSIPSGNSVAMLNLLRLGRMTANSDLEKKATRIAHAFSSSVKQSPSAHAQLMVALDAAVGPFYEVVIAGASQANDTKEMLKAIRRRFIPNKVMLFRATEEMAPGIDAIAGFTTLYPSIDGRGTAYVCTNHSCRLPSTDARVVLELLDVR
jgi:uncharacterized protein YyaL (SSP411 family)